MSKYREESHARKQETYEERKAKALTDGARVEYLSCPLCGRNQPLNTYKGQTLFQVKPDYAIIQVRYGGGRGIGFFLVLEESTTIEDLRSEYPEVADNLKEQISRLYEIFKDI